MGRALPLFELDDISVASPCHMEWSEMVGGDKVRFCGSCQKNVFNLSGMVRSEAIDLIGATEGNVCVRFFRRADGTVLTQDCPVGMALMLKRARRMTLGAVATALGAAASLVAFLSMGAATRQVCVLKTAQTHVEAIAETGTALVGDATVPEVKGEMPAIQGGIALPVQPVMGRMPAPHHEMKGKIARPNPKQGTVVQKR